jgi:membrane glycosyltransferase
MTCNEAMDRFCELDKNERFPLALTWHLLTCKKCRTAVRLCTLAERISSAPLKIPAGDAEVAALMRRLRGAASRPLAQSADSQYLSLRRWIVLGVLMVFAMFLFPFITLEGNPSTLQLSSYVVFACMITAYCAFFVGSNMDFFVKKMQTIRSNQ